MSKTFSLATVLTITHDRLLCDMDDVYEIFSHLADIEVFTHQLPTLAEGAKPQLLEKYPVLSTITVPEGLETEEMVKEFIDGLDSSIPRYFELDRMYGLELVTFVEARDRARNRLNKQD